MFCGRTTLTTSDHSTSTCLHTTDLYIFVIAQVLKHRNLCHILALILSHWKSNIDQAVECQKLQITVVSTSCGEGRLGKTTFSADESEVHVRRKCPGLKRSCSLTHTALTDGPSIVRSLFFHLFFLSGIEKPNWVKVAHS